jgi:hypothetical protein
VGPEHLTNFSCAATNAHGRGEASFFVTGWVWSTQEKTTKFRTLYG